MILNPGILFLLVCVGLLATAIVVHVSSTNLVMPTSPFLSLMPILLPILGILNAFYHPRLLFNARQSPSRTEQLFPAFLQILQGILTTALAVLFLQSARGGDELSCALSTGWQRMFGAKDEASIRRIQDALNCCGLNSVKDRAWPFNGNVPCADRFGRDTACVGPWRKATLTNSTIDLAIVLTVGVLQLLTLLFMQSASNWRHAWWAQGWSHMWERSIEERNRRLPLLSASATATVANARQNDSGDESDVPVTHRDLSPHYGAAGEEHRGRSRPHPGRMEPSSLQNIWDSN